MYSKQFLGFSLALATAGALVACGDSGSGSAPASGASGAATSKPTAAATVTAAATATATATATAAAAPAKVVGIAADEMVAASCDSIEKDSECGEVVVKAEADKAKSRDALKTFCKGKLSETACSADKIVGTCRVMKDIINHYSSEGPKKYTAETAKAACEKGHGRWVAP